QRGPMAAVVLLSRAGAAGWPARDNSAGQRRRTAWLGRIGRALDRWRRHVASSRHAGPFQQHDVEFRGPPGRPEFVFRCQGAPRGVPFQGCRRVVAEAGTRIRGNSPFGVGAGLTTVLSSTFWLSREPRASAPVADALARGSRLNDPRPIDRLLLYSR